MRFPLRPGSALLRAIMMTATALALLCLAAVPQAAASGPPPVHLRIASYNIRAGMGDDGVFDLDRTAASIRALDADVVGLQEVDVHWSDRSDFLDDAIELAHRLHLHVGFAPIYNLDPLTPGQPRRQFGVAVLSRYPIVSFINHSITRLSTQVPNPVPEPAPGFAEAVVQAPGVRVHVFCTHLDYRGDPSVRELQVADTLRIMADTADEPQVLVGDLNAEHAAPELAPLWTMLTDSTSLNDAPTYPADVPTARIDHIAVNDQVRLVAADVPDSVLARTASDHRPVTTDILIPRHRGH